MMKKILWGSKGFRVSLGVAADARGRGGEGADPMIVPA